jgi:hypothetical protein
MEQTFEEYLKKSRGDFAKVVEKYTTELISCKIKFIDGHILKIFTYR